MATEPLHVLIVDDDHLAALGLEKYLQSMGVPIYCRFSDNLVTEEPWEPNIVVVDPRTLGYAVRDLVQTTRSLFPFSRVVIYTTQSGLSHYQFAEFVDAGADAVLCKDRPNSSILWAFARVLTGGKWFEPYIGKGPVPALGLA